MALVKHGLCDYAYVLNNSLKWTTRKILNGRNKVLSLQSLIGIK